MSMGDRGRAMRVLHEINVVNVPLHKCKWEDAHQGPIPVVELPCSAGLFGRDAASDPGERSARCASDVELAVTVGRIGLGVRPGHEALRLVRRIETGLAGSPVAQQRIQEPQHQRPVVAPRPGGLVVRAVPAECH